MSELPTTVDNSAYGQLPLRQQRFVDAFIGEANCNRTKAAKLAGYSDATAQEQGSRLYADAKIRTAIDERMNDLAMSAKEILGRISAIARGSLADFIDVQPGGKKFILNLEKAEKAGVMHLLSELQELEHGPKIKLHSALEALTLLGKRHGLFVERTEISGPNGGPIAIDDSAAFDRKMADLAARIMSGSGGQSANAEVIENTGSALSR